MFTRPAYSIDELALLAKHATECERLALLVSLNCAMGPAELGRLTVDNVLLNHKHEYAEQLGFTSTEADSFVRFIRPKTRVLGEWLLWPETAEVLRWAVERAKQLGSEHIFVQKSGKPLYNEVSANPHAAFANQWDQLVKRVQQQQPEFRRLTFQTLRRTLPDTLRRTYSTELAMLCLAYGERADRNDWLRSCRYRRFGRLHEAIRQLREMFEPVLAHEALAS